MYKYPYFIAEVGFNHEGNMDVAKEMIQAAAEAGADAVKFQSFRAADIALPSSEHFSMIQRGELSEAQHVELALVAKDCKLDFMSTPYSFWAIDMLERIGVPAYKIASMDLNNHALVRYAANTGKPVIISTGMALLDEIKVTVEVLRAFGCTNFTLLHCISEYPVDASDINMHFMQKIQKEYSCSVGYSVHTVGTDACQVAAILGAEVIE